MDVDVRSIVYRPRIGVGDTTHRKDGALISTSIFRRPWFGAVVVVTLVVASSCTSSNGSSTTTTTVAATSSTASTTLVTTTTSTMPASTTVATTTESTLVDEDAAVASLYEAVGNRNADTVLVFAQGGPAPGLDSIGFGLLTEGLDLDAVYVLNVHQAQTLDPETFTMADIDFDAAIAADDESVRILGDIVTHFQSRNKRVVVLGISYGAFLVQDLLSKQGNLADAYVIVVGRLDVPEQAWRIFADGGAVEFIDGVDPTEVPIEAFGYGTGTPEGERNMSRLLAGVMANRYTQLWTDLDLANVIFVYGDADEQVGRLTDDEIRFLEAGGATVLRGSGGHVDAIFAQTGPALAIALEQ